MDWINGIIDYLNSIITGIQYLVDSVLNFVRWIPSILSFTFGGSFLFLLPASLIGICIVVVAIYIIRIIVGGENK